MGFCFLNNAAIAAKYAQAKFGLARVAVIDFDVHHGNGTVKERKEAGGDIVVFILCLSCVVAFCWCHVHRLLSCLPCHVQEKGFLQDETCFYGSTHEKDNYPGTGVDPSPLIGEQARTPKDRRIVNRTLRKGPKSRDDFVLKWTQV